MTTLSSRIIAIESGYRNATNYANPVQKGFAVSGDPAVTAMGNFSSGGESSGTTLFNTTTYLSSPSTGDTLTYYPGSGAGVGTGSVSIDILSATLLEGTLAQQNTIALSPPGLEYPAGPGQLAIFTNNNATTTFRKIGRVNGPISAQQCFVIPYGGAEDPDTFNFATGDTVMYTISTGTTGSATISSIGFGGSDNGFTVQFLTFDSPVSLTNGDYISIVEPTDKSISSTFIQNRRLPRLIY